MERELKKDQPIKFIGARRSSQAGVQTPETNSSTERVPKKRTRPEVSSPDSSTEKQPSKRQADNEQAVNILKEEHGNLRPELIELKRQLFAGFEQLIEPIKKDIQALKSERKSEAATLCVETVNRKFLRNEAKQQKIENRLSMIEDQIWRKI